MSNNQNKDNDSLQRSLLKESLASSLSSNLLEEHVPIPLHDTDNGTSTFGRRSSGVSSPSEQNGLRKERSYSSAVAVAGQALQSIRRSMSMSATASIDSNGTDPLQRIPTGYTVRDIYGDMDENDINLQRTLTRSTILTTLSHRVQPLRYRTALRAPTTKEEEAEGEEYEQVYEGVPDISVPTKEFGAEFAAIDPELVTWDGDDDPHYPRNWSRAQKVFQTLIVALYTLISPMSSSILSPAMEDIAASLHMNSDFIMSFAVSVMVLAWALGPLIIAPISELDACGRRPVLNISIWVIFVFNLACGFAKTTTQLCVFRFLGGLGGCAALNVGAGTLADLWSDSERQMAMAAYSICPSLGPILSPVISSFIIQAKDWPWVFYVLAIFNGAVAIFGTIFFRETYSPRLLKDKAKRIRKATGNNHIHTIFEVADGLTKWEKIVLTSTRPLKLLCTHPMIIGLGSFMAFVYGFMYLMIVTFPSVWKGTYGFKTGVAGLLYLPMGIGFMLGTVFWSYAIDHIYHKLTARNNGVPKPEYRLPCLLFSGFGIPVGLIWYGWSAEKKLHWIMPSIGSAIFAFAFIAVFQTIQNYLIDMNNRFAASSVAAAAVFRSLFGFLFPLFANKMYERLNYGWGNTMCGLIALALGLPFPIICFYYGERMRNWANNRMDREQAQRDARNLERLRKQEVK